MIKSTFKKIIIPFLGILLFIGVWALAAKIVNFELKLPSPYKALLGFFDLLGQNAFYKAVVASIFRALRGFIVSFFVAALFCILSVSFKWFRSFISPIITIFRSLPTISIILVVLIWLKSNIAPAFIAGLIVFPLMYASFCSAVDNVDKDIISMSKLYRVSTIDVIKRYYIPEILPTVFDTLKSNISLNFKVVIASEVLAQTYNSIGVNMQSAKSFLDTSSLMAWTVVAVLVSFALESLVSALKYLILKGRGYNG